MNLLEDKLENIRKIAKNNVREKIVGIDSLLRFLKRWWCRQYNRPYKDPLLEQYTIEDLFLEFYEVYYFDKKDDPLDDEDKEELLGPEEDFNEWIESKEELGGSNGD